MGDEWDAEDFDADQGFSAPEAVTTQVPNDDKWAGEDEDDVKDNWEEGSDEEKDEGENKAVQVKKKKSLKEKIAEKEEKKRKELEERKRQEEDRNRKLTPEEMLAEKVRLQKLQEENELEMVKESLGLVNEELNANKTGLEAMLPSNLQEFEDFEKRIKDKILEFEKSPYFLGFLDSLFRDVSAGLEADDIKKLASTLNTMASEKSKAHKAKSKKKGKGKASINTGKSDVVDYEEGGYDEFDDIM